MRSLSSIVVALLCLAAAANGQPPPLGKDEPPQPRKYVGDLGCAECHRAKADTYHSTAHYLTSRLPDQASIPGSFAAGANILKTSNPDLFFRMETKNGEFLQTAVQGVSPYTTSHTEKFGIVIGSGGKGQTYLYWKSDELFQLPVSYWTQVGWVNSPGYRDGTANFDRPIVPRCLECHATSFHAAAPSSNRYDKTDLVMGITCEKCHGPASVHIERVRAKADTAADPGLPSLGRLARERQMDLCAWCHAGRGRELLPSFSYVPGEVLEKYIDLPQPGPEADIDVHGSQVELLKKSRCYQSSSMTCLTCHDIHVPQHEAASFNGICVGCHKPQAGMFPKGHDAASNCIECHMPKQKTSLIVFDWNGKKVTPEVRTHWIKTYTAEAKHDP